MPQASRRNASSIVWRLASARAISDAGSWAATIAFAITIFRATHSTVWLSMAFLVTQGPAAFLAPVAGALADRFDRQRIMITSDLLAGGCYGLLVFFRSPPELLAIGAIAALLHLPFGPASRAALPNLVPPDELSRANSILQGAGNVGVVLGPALGGGLLAALGAGTVFAVNAVSFAVSAALVKTIRGAFRAESTTPARVWNLQGLLAGFAFILREPALLTLTVVAAITFLASEVGWVADLPLVRLFGAGSKGYGVMMAAWGAGLMTGSLLAARTVSERTEFRAAVLGTLVFGVFVAFIGLAPVFAVVPVSLFLLGAGDSFAIVGFTGLYQRRTPDEIRGRMFAATGAVMTLATAIGYSFAGFVVRAAGPRPVYVVGGVIDVLSAIVLAVVLRQNLTEVARSDN